MTGTAVAAPIVQNNQLPSSVQNAPDWRTAVRELTDFAIGKGLCFSSGEIAAVLRLKRPDLAFKVTSLGAYVQDLFYTRGMASYDDGMGGLVQPCQVARTTQGLGRTPAGKTVFVYGPDPNACQVHAFEVDIPSASGMPGSGWKHFQTTPVTLNPGHPTQNFTPVQPPPQAPQTAPTPALPPAAPVTPIQITGSRANDDTQAYVLADRRLCIPRPAFENYVKICGHVMRGGDPVYVEFGMYQVIITMTPSANSVKYDLATTRGRICVTVPSRQGGNPGDKFAISVNNGELKVDLSQAL